MIIQSAQFIKSATRPSHYPPALLPEIAFLGRSNVGKSSLINALVNRKKLVKTSRTPGRTQQINFFEINQAFCFVDLPGYGYAKVPRTVQKNWPAMMKAYFSGRQTLKGVVLIMDLRRMPGPEEMDLLAWFETLRIPSIRILTKADKLSRIKQTNQQNLIARSCKMDKDRLILFSAKSNQGRESLWREIEKLLGIDRDEPST